MKQHVSMVDLLIKKGVKIHNPDSIFVDEHVQIDRIGSKGIVIHPGCKIFGAATFISKDCDIGKEGPVTIDNCQIGPEVKLKGGHFENAVFLEKVQMGSGSHVRGGTICEEESNTAHTVGLKQTILFPFVTLGSLINFCDCLMAGGTSRKDHSEVGSSYIHFNFTPNQDKATASLIGDVAKGVMLDQPPIFLGGQGGLVGPCRLAYGTTIAAGSIYRKDELNPNRLLGDGVSRKFNLPITVGLYKNIKRIIQNNIIYIGNMIALSNWYKSVRSMFIDDMMPEPVFLGLLDKLDMILDERIKRLRALSEKMPKSIDLYLSQNANGQNDSPVIQQTEFYQQWKAIETLLNQLRNYSGNAELRDPFLQSIDRTISKHGKQYIDVIKNLGLDEKNKGTNWLQGIVDHIYDSVLSHLESINIQSS